MSSHHHYVMSSYILLLPSPGTLHSAGAEEEAEAGRSQRGRWLAWGGPHVRGPTGCPGQFEEIGLRLCPSGRIWRADHLREEHEALVPGPGLLCLPTQLQLDRHTPQEETCPYSHSPQHFWGLQPGTQLSLRVSSTTLKLLLGCRRLTRYTY